MAGVVRLGDLCSCVCCCHHNPKCRGTIGIAITGANSVLTNSSPTVRLTDMFMCDCGHPTFVVSASSTVFAEKLQVARLGDVVSGCPTGIIITSSDNVLNTR